MTENYPVIVGLGQLTNRPQAIEETIEPIEMLARVAREAESDAGASGLLQQADSVQVVNFFSWQYADAPGLLAEKVGAKPAETVYTAIGGETPQRLVNETAQAIVEGRTRVALLAGAEAMYSRRLSRQTERSLPWSQRGTPQQIAGDMRQGFSEVEARHGATMPTRMYPLFENAIRAQAGRTVEEHQRFLGELYSRFAAVAAENTHAWFREAYSPQEISEATADNRMVCFPYTKRMNAIMEVDQSAAVILTGSETARELGIPEEKWVYLHGCGDANDKWFVSERVNYHSSPAIRAATSRALGMAGVTVDRVAAFDLYSCFPSAVQMALDALGMDAGDERAFTVTGGLAYAGGPGNNYVMHSISAMAERLRDRRGEYGLVTGLGWFATKHSAGVYSAERPSGEWRRTEPGADQAEVDSMESPPFVEEAEGDAVIETYTVAFDREGEPEQGIVVGRLRDSGGAGAQGPAPLHRADAPRFFANTPAVGELLRAMTREEFVGRPGQVTYDASTKRNVFRPA